MDRRHAETGSADQKLVNQMTRLPGLPGCGKEGVMTMNLSVEVPFTCYLHADGTTAKFLPAWAQDDTRLQSLLLPVYRDMVFTRVFDTRAIALQRTGRLGTYASCLGQEAISAAIGAALLEGDLFVPYYRDLATQFRRGVSPLEVLLYWGGDERGNAWQHCHRDLPNCVPIATQCCHAAGAAAAFRVRGEHHAVVCTLGDGASSRGDFLEALNLAGVWQLPVVYVIHNNQWAISVPRSLQCGADTLAQKAVGAGLPGEQVDGNDALAVYDRVQAALARARAGKGATLIEAITYRLSDHTTADDASRYRSPADLKAAWEREPIGRLRDFLVSRQLWSEWDEKSLYRDCEARIAAAVEAYLAMPVEAPEQLMDALFAELPATMRSQREELLRRAARAAEGGHS